MQKSDFSIEIFDKYYGQKLKLVRVVLKRGKELHGLFVGVFHGDQEKVLRNVTGKRYLIAISRYPEALNQVQDLD